VVRPCSNENGSLFKMYAIKMFIINDRVSQHLKKNKTRIILYLHFQNIIEYIFIARNTNTHEPLKF